MDSEERPAVPLRMLRAPQREPGFGAFSNRDTGSETSLPECEETSEILETFSSSDSLEPEDVGDGEENKNLNNSQRLEAGTVSEQDPAEDPVTLWDIEEEGAARLEDVWDPRPPSSCNSSLDRKEKALVPYKPSPSASSSSSSSSSSPSSEAKPDLHCLCQMFYSFSSEAAKKVARYAAENILELFLNHVLQTTESECDMFLVAVILATEGDGMHAILRHLVLKIHEEPCGGSPEERERQLQVKVKAIRIIGAIVTHIPYAPVLSEWVYTLAVVVGDFMASEVLSPEGTSPRTYMAPKEIAKIIKTLVLTWDLISKKM